MPAPTGGPGTMHLRFPLSHSRGKLVSFLRDSPYQWEGQEDALSVQLPDGTSQELATELTKILTSTELADVRVIFQKKGQIMQLHDF
ncbi:MAG TPA: hypothetical protein VF719_07990, partial [Abditibacteriaceae bacterium]